MRKTINTLTMMGIAIAALSGAEATAQDKVSWEKDILPFVKNSCYKCHLPAYQDERGRTRKPKGGYVFTNKEALMASEGEDGDKFFVPGDPKKSRFLQVTLLPIDSDMHFPPEGKADELTDAQKKLLEKWITEGADFGDWEKDEEVEKDPAAYAASLK